MVCKKLDRDSFINGNVIYDRGDIVHHCGKEGLFSK